MILQCALGVPPCLAIRPARPTSHGKYTSPISKLGFTTIARTTTSYTHSKTYPKSLFLLLVQPINHIKIKKWTLLDLLQKCFKKRQS